METPHIPFGRPDGNGVILCSPQWQGEVNGELSLYPISPAEQHHLHGTQKCIFECANVRWQLAATKVIQDHYHVVCGGVLDKINQIFTFNFIDLRIL